MELDRIETVVMNVIYIYPFFRMLVFISQAAIILRKQLKTAVFLKDISASTSIFM